MTCISNFSTSHTFHSQQQQVLAYVTILANEQYADTAKFFTVEFQLGLGNREYKGIGFTYLCTFTHCI